MKKIQFRKFVVYMFIASMFLAIFSCKKDEDTVGQPTLSMISPLKDLKTSITTAQLGDWIAIQGVNLEATTSILFNDVSVDMTQIYYEDSVLYLQVPKVIPTNFTNKIVLETPSGQITYDFNVTFPDLKVTGMLNEYTPVGDTLKIFGDFFKLYNVDSTTTVVDFNGVRSKVIRAMDTYLTVKVPTGITENIKLTVINTKYNVSAVCPGYFRDKNHIITNFDDVTYPGASGVNFIGEWPKPKPTSGNYSLVHFGVEGTGWDYMIDMGYSYTQDMIDHPDNYVVKFEFNMLSPVSTTKFIFYPYWALPSEIIDTDLAVKDMGTWETISIPLEKIIPLNYDGDKSYLASFNIRVESIPGTAVLCGFDNFRIYQKE